MQNIGSNTWTMISTRCIKERQWCSFQKQLRSCGFAIYGITGIEDAWKEGGTKYDSLNHSTEYITNSTIGNGNVGRFSNMGGWGGINLFIWYCENRQEYTSYTLCASEINWSLVENQRMWSEKGLLLIIVDFIHSDYRRWYFHTVV